MKFFSRKTLVAGATALAISFSGVAAANAETTPDNTKQESSASDFFAGSSDENGKISPKEIREWIKMFTDIIDAMDDALSMADKYLMPK
ncbi:hypothetical protein [Corynebacterium sp.]|uniref:hypothetical protein n=1 Tax=Corynebacterium sp. TaxID=1720 RepID=UPI0026DD7013|nr:hypothetical protein [Corynebacterium sp.]MDO5031756.1 hypothetical protein [Corynebacterium sp.]